MKKIYWGKSLFMFMLASALLAISSAVKAADSTTTSTDTTSGIVSINLPAFGATDITSFVKTCRVGIAYNIGDTDKYTDAHMSLVSFHRSDGVELVNINGGAVWRTSDGNSGGKVALGLRPDNLWKLAFSGTWATAHTTVTPISPVEVNFGPAFLALSGYKAKIEWAFGIAYNFGS